MKFFWFASNATTCITSRPSFGLFFLKSTGNVPLCLTRVQKWPSNQMHHLSFLLSFTSSPVASLNLVYVFHCFTRGAANIMAGFYSFREEGEH